MTYELPRDVSAFLANAQPGDVGILVGTLEFPNPTRRPIDDILGEWLPKGTILTSDWAVERSLDVRDIEINTRRDDGTKPYVMWCHFAGLPGHETTFETFSVGPFDRSKLWPKHKEYVPPMEVA